MIMTIDDDIDDDDDDLCYACRSQYPLFQAFARFIMHDEDKKNNLSIIVMVLRGRLAMVMIMMIIVMITIYT